MHFFLWVILSAALADSEVPTRIGAGGAADLLNITQPPAELTGTTANFATKFKLTCTTSHGDTIDSKHANYQSCMEESKNKNKALPKK